ncbi:hypothetical protein CASFOL_026635 [Castilleja foliolosa]|uniref:KIB1-4 beta-propeller domain-containing protein n=1 Tax=Castilleja foliolosa TaxID=1961234 RepID=A0ABD3CHL9_9LAMI
MALSSSSSSLHRPICPKGIFGSSSSSSSNYCHFVKLSARSCTASSFKLRGLSTATATTAIQAVQNEDSPGPWLMLPPEYEDGEISYKECKTGLRQLGKMTYKFYSLFDNKLQTHCPDDVIRDLRLVCRGSSHGWLALLGPRNEGFFLYNPITRRHIMLPSIFNLPKLPGDDILRLSCGTSWRDVHKLILTCSPDEDEENCRAVMMNSFGNMLAVCCPGRSKEWTMMRDEERGNRWYNDCVYSTSRKLLYGLTNRNGLETWDIGDPSSPKLIKVDEHDFFPSFEMPLWSLCLPTQHLVVAGEDLLLVVQYIVTSVGPDGSCFHYKDQQPRPDNCRHMTIRFDVFKHDLEKGRYAFVDYSPCLGGFAIFVGSSSHSVAIPADRFPELKPDSIYFTDGHFYGDAPLDGYDTVDEKLDGRDIGIYNYRDKTVSQCHYPWDIVKNNLTSPIWFFPSSTI